MRYIWDSNKPRNVCRVMHIELINGEETFQAFCGIKLDFNRSINAPFSLGHKVCKKCLRVIKNLEKRI